MSVLWEQKQQNCIRYGEVKDMNGVRIVGKMPKTTGGKLSKRTIARYCKVWYYIVIQVGHVYSTK